MFGQQYENMIEHGCLKIGYAQFYRYVNRTNIYLSINISDNPRRYIPFFISIIIDILKKISLSPILSHIIPLDCMMLDVSPIIPGITFWDTPGPWAWRNRWDLWILIHD